MTLLVWLLTGFFAGSLMFSLWLGKLALGTDIRAYGDGNPGATNLMKAGGKTWGIAGLLLDVLKGAIPVGLATFYAAFNTPSLILIAFAPILGHAFSPWLGFKGGKAVAVTFGVWTGLTAWEAPTVLGICLGVGAAFIAVSGWALLFALVGLLIYFLLTNPNPVYLGVWLGSAALLTWKYRADLGQFPQPQPWLKERLGWN
jgi:glycerol-3-phosphate acyltransferase PlsY